MHVLVDYNLVFSRNIFTPPNDKNQNCDKIVRQWTPLACDSCHFFYNGLRNATPTRIGDRAINVNQLFTGKKKKNQLLLKQPAGEIFLSLFLDKVNTQTPNAIFFHHYYSEKLISNIVSGEEVPYHLSTTRVKILSIIKFKGSNYIIILKFTR